MIKVSDLVESLHLEVLSPAPTTSFSVKGSETNRPGLQLTGFWEFFAAERPQIIGRVESVYLSSLPPALREERLRRQLHCLSPVVLPRR